MGDLKHSRRSRSIRGMLDTQEPQMTLNLHRRAQRKLLCVRKRVLQGERGLFCRSLGSIWQQACKFFSGTLSHSRPVLVICKSQTTPSASQLLRTLLKAALIQSCSTKPPCGSTQIRHLHLIIGIRIPRAFVRPGMAAVTPKLITDLHPVMCRQIEGVFRTVWAQASARVLSNIHGRTSLQVPRVPALQFCSEPEGSL